MSAVQDKVILVSGGARGMGAEDARVLVENHAKVVIGDVLEPEGERLANELGEDSVFVPLDVTSADGWQRAVGLAVETFGRLDGLVNNAGVLIDHRLDTATAAEWERVIAVNQTGVFLGMKAAVPELRRAGGGSIVNISSTGGMVGFTDCFAYVASKWAVRGMTKAAALELAVDGIRVNSVHPGDTATDMIAGAIADGGAVTTVDSIPLGRYGTTRDIAHLVTFLLGDHASYLTGAELVVDGGSIAGVSLG